MDKLTPMEIAPILRPPQYVVGDSVLGGLGFRARFPEKRLWRSQDVGFTTAVIYRALWHTPCTYLFFVAV